MVLEARLVGPQDPLLDKGVALLVKNRPDLADESKPEDLVTTAVQVQEMGRAGKKEFVIVVGENLDDPQNAKVSGYVNGIFFPRSGASVLTYLEVAPESKGIALERPMYDLAVQKLAQMRQEAGVGPKPVFIELEDHKLYTDPAEIAKVKKENAFFTGSGIGAVEVGQAFAGKELDYRQPWWWKKDGLLRLHSIPDETGSIGTPQDVKAYYQDLHDFHSTPKLNSRVKYAPVRARCERNIDGMIAAHDARLRQDPDAAPAPGGMA